LERLPGAEMTGKTANVAEMLAEQPVDRLSKRVGKLG
jgi:hypothetical protein